MPDPFSRFHNATLTVERAETEESYRGEEQVTSSTVLQERCDLQEGGRSLRRARDVYEQADAVVFTTDVASAEPEDQVTIETDDGRTLEGTVGQVMPLDDKLLISLDG